MNRNSLNSVQSFVNRRWLRVVGSIAFCLFGGCASVTLDLSNIEEPVMLTPLPYRSATWSLTELGDFLADTTHATGGSSQVGTSSSSQILENDVQLKIFEAIGGHSRRVLAIDEVEVSSGGGNLLLVYVEMATVQLRGRILELESNTDGTEPSQPGGEQ